MPDCLSDHSPDSNRGICCPAISTMSQRPRPIRCASAGLPTSVRADVSTGRPRIPPPRRSEENMTRQHGFVRSIAIATACTVGLVLGVRAADPPNFKPDGTFKGSALTGWQVVGDAVWTAQNGEIIGKAKPGTSGGWLVLDKRFQDVRLYLNYRCSGECKSGVLLRAKKAADGGMTGVFVSLADGDTGYYSVGLDASGKETSRDQLSAPGRGGAGAAPAANAARGAAAAPDAAAAGRGRGRGGRGGDAAAPAAPATPPARGTQVGSGGRPRPTLKAG